MLPVGIDRSSAIGPAAGAVRTRRTPSWAVGVSCAREDGFPARNGMS